MARRSAIGYGERLQVRLGQRGRRGMYQQRCVGRFTGAAPPQQGVGPLTDALPAAHVVRAYPAADRASP